MTLIFGLIAAALYVGSIRTNVAEQAVQLKALEKNHDSFASQIRADMTRLEAAFERRLADILDRIKPGAPAVPAEKKPQ